MAKDKSAIGAAIVANVGGVVAPLVDNENIAGAKKPLVEPPELKPPEPPGARPRGAPDPKAAQGAGAAGGGKKGPRQ